MLHFLFFLNEVFNATFGWIAVVYVWTPVFRMGPDHPIRNVCKRVVFELRWLFAVTQVFDVGSRVMSPDHSITNKIFMVLINTWFTWWILSWKDDDDRWKKRRKRAVEAIKQVGSRLVVVPVLTPQPVGAR